MNYNLSKFKKPIDKKNPLSFFNDILVEEKFNRFIDNLYPEPVDGDGFTKNNDGSYSFYVITGFYNKHHDLIDSSELYEGSIYNDLEEVFNFYCLEIDTLLENRKMEHVFESKRLDNKYVELLINNVDKLLSEIEFIKNKLEKEIVSETLQKLRKIINGFLSNKIPTPLNQEIFEFAPQFSYLLGEIKQSDIERIYMIAESNDLIDNERNDLGTFLIVFSSINPKQITNQILFYPDRSLVTAFMYALKEIYKDFNLPKVGLSEAFYYIENNNKKTLITDGSLNAHHTRCQNSKKYQIHFSMFLKELNIHIT